MNGDLKTTFIQQTLAQYNKECIDAMQVMMQRLKIKHSGEAAQSFAYNAFMNGGGASSNLTFREYLRFVDMGVGRGNPLGGMSSMKVSLQAQHKEGEAQLNKRRRKPKKFYSRIVYGKLTWLQNQLLYGYTEETVQMLKKNLEQKN